VFSLAECAFVWQRLEMTAPPEPSSGTVQSAVKIAQNFLRDGDKTAAMGWLDRAHRMARKDAHVRLLLATALAGLDDARCRTVLCDLLQDYPAFPQAQIALCAATFRQGDIEAATPLMASVLAGAAPPDNADFSQLADRLVMAAGLPGWIGAHQSGHVLLSTPDKTAATPVDIYLDGAFIGPLNAGKGRLRRHALPKSWKAARSLSAAVAGVALLGSPIDLVALRRVQGFVRPDPSGGLTGWAWCPADAQVKPLLSLVAEQNSVRTVTPLRADDANLKFGSEDGPARPYGFHVPAQLLPAAARLRVLAPDGSDLQGSPLFLSAEKGARRTAAAVLAHALHSSQTQAANPPPDVWRPLPVDLVAQPDLTRPIPPRRPIDIVIPVYRGAADYKSCLASLQRRPQPNARLVVVDDASPDAELRDALESDAARGDITLLRQDQNRGFPAAANLGLRGALTGGRDVVLLNADTLLPLGWLSRLVAVAYAEGSIGSVTPFTNEGSIVSYPNPNGANPVPDLATVDRLDRRMQKANGKGWHELPTAVGFCMFIRHDCLAQVGVFREDAFAQGYGEENDWSLRARQLGWQHVAATGVFVGHIGGQSFGPNRRHLLARNLAVLNRLHPGYDDLISDFLRADPLAAPRHQADAQVWAAGRMARGAVILITHNDGGGVDRFVSERCAALRSEGWRPIVLRPAVAKNGPAGIRLSEGLTAEFPNLCFALPTQCDALLRLLRAENPGEVEIHHLLGHVPEVQTLMAQLALPYRVFVHDYALWCPRITLCTSGPRYCGEPLDPSVCTACVRDNGQRMVGAPPVAQHRANAARLLAGASMVVAPCEDVATRVGRHFPGLRPIITPWEDERAITAAVAQPRPKPGPEMPWRILVVGAIGPEKGYDVLLGCVRDAARRSLRLSFVIAGYTMDDSRLLDSGPIFITGAFEEAEAVTLARAQQAHLGFVPSIWPETWCYSLSTLWRAGLHVAAFALGAQAQRISRTGLGTVLPLGVAPERINDMLLRYVSNSL